MTVVLITGGAGFIGANLVNFLEKKQMKLIILDNLSNGDFANPDAFKSIEKITVAPQKQNWTTDKVFINGSILDKPLIKACVEASDYVVHLAANSGVQQSILNPVDDLLVNGVGTCLLLDECSKANVKHVVLASSGAVVGGAELPITENSILSPKSPYAVSKVSSEYYAKIFSDLYGLNTSVLRFSNVYGPYSHLKTSVIANFCRNTISGLNLKVSGNGLQTRDFIFVKDLVSAIYSCMITDIQGCEKYQISSGYEVSIIDLINCIEVLCREKGLVFPGCEFVDRLSGDVARNFADNSKAVRMLDWRPDISLEDGISATLQYFEETLCE